MSDKPKSFVTRFRWRMDDFFVALGARPSLHVVNEREAFAADRRRVEMSDLPTPSSLGVPDLPTMDSLGVAGIDSGLQGIPKMPTQSSLGVPQADVALKRIPPMPTMQSLGVPDLSTIIRELRKQDARGTSPTNTSRGDELSL